MSTEIQDFAALLRGLKERSGLSYGALAQKLHMSTSTIHRYCNGEAVPHDYAPVERFARVCRATSDELMRLHRQWILADEAKRRGATRKTEAAGAAEPVAVTPELTAPPEPEPGPEPVPVPPPAGLREPEAEPESESESESAADDVTPDARPVGAARPARGRLSSKRLRVLLATTAVVALTVPTALAINHYSGDRTREEGMDTPRSSAPVTPSRSGSTSPSPSPSKPSPSATSGSASPSATAKKSTGPLGSDGEGEKNTGFQGVPVTSTLSSYNWDWPCGQYYVLDRDPKGMPPVPDVQDRARRNWAAQLGGVDGGKMLIELTLQGASEQAVVLKALHVRVVKQEAANDWPAYSMGEGCGGGIVPQSFNIDLDDSRPVSRPVAGEDAGKVVPAKNFPYRVSSTDVEVFHVNAHTEDHDVTWYLELDWSSGGRTGTLRIDDNGKPFRTSSMKDRPVYEYRQDTAEWEDISESLEGQGS
ncbi:helix-turn-helix domain-containing protein [Streptomyces sp. NBC_00385]|uniref:helix-turn-helix domain-containing protein n=1 Tax=Streptomyces sp. NBC_00385 TaxID=2975733 RepID=UPI002DDA9E6B|nr:helix-turn-helix transcriptional regulator [Streptomyces sp. NBC_00385]WRZ05707.1 helix-turn-helix domain-containing protein [Streptomyces sp. NBC_00385]